jgi:hypothetical protein
MYDNLDYILRNHNCPGDNFIQTVPQYLTKITSQGVSEFGEYVNGYLDSLKVSITESRVKIHNSSTCKYYHGNNFKTLTRSDTKKAIEQISDSLHIPFHLANITRIDIAQNFIMKYPESVYYFYLGEAQYYNRVPQSNGIYYNNLLRQLVFYGKVHEQKDKKQTIPELYKNRNVLRYEIRFKKRLNEQFNKSEITAGLLYDENFYNDIVTRWKNEYLAIQKINSKLNSMKPTGSTKELIENMALFQLQEMGQPKLLALIKEWQSMGLIDKTEANRHRNKIKELSSTSIDYKGNELIAELNQKVKEAARFA